jgi:hypothetical protein
MRKCGELGIPYEEVISSQYGKSKGWPPGKCMKQHKEGMARSAGDAETSIQARDCLLGETSSGDWTKFTPKFGG